MSFFNLFLLFVSIFAVPGIARIPDYQTIPLMLATNAGWGTNVYVTGEAPELGGGDPLRAIKLYWTEGNTWTGRVAVRKGWSTSYRYILRDGSAGRYCDTGNVITIEGSEQVAGRPGKTKWPGKIIYYYSGWTGVTLVVRSDTNEFKYPMHVVGPGRGPDERLFRASRVGTIGTEISFFLEGPGGPVRGFDFPPGETGEVFYRTSLDNFVIQDGGIYTYWPSNQLSAPRMESDLVASSVDGIPGRSVRMYLPRGYDEHVSRRYPVVYFQDGTNVFSPGGSFGSWDADITATREIGMGRMRESILVAIDNTSARRSEYNADGDGYPGEEPGRASRYLDYLAQDVMPLINDRYRTLTGAVDQVVAGSSMGGIFSVYAVFATNRFGAALAMSPSFTRAPLFTSRIIEYPKPSARIYMDTGNREGMIGPGPGGDYWESVWWGYDQLLMAGFTPGNDLLMRIGCGHGHSEAAWRDRLAEAFRFLLNPLAEPVMEERVTFSEEAPTH